MERVVMMKKQMSEEAEEEIVPWLLEIPLSHPKGPIVQ